MDRKAYTETLLRFGRELKAASPPEARSAYLQQLIRYGTDLASNAGSYQSAEAPEITKEAVAEFLSVFGPTPQHILWRVAGAVAARRRSLPIDASRAIHALGGAHDLLGPLGCEFHEPSYSRVLAFLMSPRLAGATGEACQRAFFRLVSAASDQGPPVTFHAPFAVEAEHVGTWGRVDVSMESRQSIVWIEAKVGAAEGTNQLQRYAQGLLELTRYRPVLPVLVFLTSDPKQTPTTVMLPVVHITFKQLLGAWLPIASQLNEQDGAYLKAYLKSIAMHFYGLAAPGPFENWPLAVQRRALDFVEKGVDLQ